MAPPIFGPPTSHAVVPHQNSCSGFVGCAAQAWNSFAGAVVTGLTEVASFAWSTTFAIAYYFANLVVAAARLLDEYAIQPTASAIETVGAAIVSALNTLLSYIISLVKTSFDAALQPFFDAESAYAEGVNATIDPTGPAAVWQAIGGSLLQIGFAIAVVVEVAITLIFAIFPGFSVANLLLGLIIGASLSVAMAVIPALVGISTSMVTACQSWAGGYTSQSSVSSAWSSWVNTISYWEAGPSNEFAATVLTAAWDSAPVSLPTAFAFTVAGLAMDWDAGAGGGKLASVSATTLEAISWILALKAKTVVDDIPALAFLDNTIQVADGLALGWDVFELAQGN